MIWVHLLSCGLAGLDIRENRCCRWVRPGVQFFSCRFRIWLCVSRIIGWCCLFDDVLILCDLKWYFAFIVFFIFFCVCKVFSSISCVLFAITLISDQVIINLIHILICFRYFLDSGSNLLEFRCNNKGSYKSAVWLWSDLSSLDD